MMRWLWGRRLFKTWIKSLGQVDVEYVTPGIVFLVKEILKKHASIRGILLECTELPPYADALRSETKLPVFDAITNADFFISARKETLRSTFYARKSVDSAALKRQKHATAGRTIRVLASTSGSWDGMVFRTASQGHGCGRPATVLLSRISVC